MCQVVEKEGKLIVNSDVDEGAEVPPGEVHQVKSIPKNLSEAQRQRKLTSLLGTDPDQTLEKVIVCALEYHDVISLEDDQGGITCVEHVGETSNHPPIQ